MTEDMPWVDDDLQDAINGLKGVNFPVEMIKAARAKRAVLDKNFRHDLAFAPTFDVWCMGPK